MDVTIHHVPVAKEPWAAFARPSLARGHGANASVGTVAAMALFGSEVGGGHADASGGRTFRDPLTADRHRVVEGVNLDLFVVYFELANAASKT